MISNSDSPVEWAMLLTELDDARDHLESLIGKMADSNEMEESEYAVDLGHVFAHLNRAWKSRDLRGSIPEGEWEEYSQFPANLQPVG